MTYTQAVRDSRARWQRRRRRLINYGAWQPFVDAEPVRQHVLAIRDAGMSVKNLSVRAGVSIATLDYLLYGDDKHEHATLIRTESAEALLAYWPVLDDFLDNAVIDATGTVRRLRALGAAGWPAATIHTHIDFVATTTIERCRYQKQVTARLARAVRDFYAWASTRKPEDHGVAPWLALRCRNLAAKRGWEDPSGWDDDLIDDPDAHPDWTGYCGTDRGFWTHRLHQLPMCTRCEEAHEQWLAEHAHLTNTVRNQRMFAARAAASNRGASIANDARELMRLGHDYDQAAARIGVTRQHLQQELHRHPETELEAAA